MNTNTSPSCKYFYFLQRIEAPPQKATRPKILINRKTTNNMPDILLKTSKQFVTITIKILNSSLHYYTTLSFYHSTFVST